MDEQDELCTLGELAAMTGIAYETLASYIRRYRGLIPTEGQGRRRYPARAVETLLSIHRQTQRREGRATGYEGLSSYERLLDKMVNMSDLVTEVEGAIETIQEKLEGDMVTIRVAHENDFFPLYNLALRTEELQVSPDNPFMEPAEFTHCLINKEDWIVLTAVDEDGLHAGFIVALVTLRSACIYYLAVAPRFALSRVGTDLLSRCLEELRRRGVKRVGGFAHDNIRLFLSERGFTEGGTYVWMERRIV